MSKTRPRHYEFGAFQLDTAEYRLLRNGDTVPLPPKAFDLLLVLIEHSGHVLNKDELMTALWSDTIVEEANLAHTVSALRKALGETEEQKYIETIPKRGYRFVASVKEAAGEQTTLVVHEHTRTRLVLEDEEEVENGRSSIEDRGSKIEEGIVVQPSGYAHSADAVAVAVLPRQSSILKPLSTILGLIALVVAGTLGAAYVLREPTEARAVRSLIPLPGKPDLFPANFEFGPQLSPDGTRIVFVARTEGQPRQLWVHTLSTLSAQPLAGTEGIDVSCDPFWSPDGRYIGFFWNGKLMKIPASGGPVVTLCEATAGDRGGTWSQEGVIVFSPGTGGPLYQVSAAGGVPAPVTRLEEAHGVVSHRYPFFLPNGRHFLYLGRCKAGTESEGDSIYIASLDSNESKPVVQSSYSAGYANGYLLFIQQDNLMAQSFDTNRLEAFGEAMVVAEQVKLRLAPGWAAFSVSQRGDLVYLVQEERVSHLTWFDRSGNSLGVLGDPVAGQSAPRISPDGKRVMVTIWDPKTKNSDIWIYEVARGIRTRFTSDPARDSTPVWSPDGSRIVFSSNRKRQWDLYQGVSTGVDNEEPIFESDLIKHPMSWSPDGRFILYWYWNHETKWDLGILPVLGEQGARLDAGEPFPFLYTKFSESAGQFAPDGRWIAFTWPGSGRHEVHVVPFPGPGEKHQISIAGGHQPRWRADGTEIFYVAPGSKLMVAAVSIEGSTLEVGAVRELFGTRSYGESIAFDVTPDGQRFLVGVAAEPTGPPRITLVTNWTADLKH